MKLGDVPRAQPGGCEDPGGRVSIQSPDLNLFLLLNHVYLSGCSQGSKATMSDMD